MKAIVFIGHGSKSDEGNQKFAFLIEQTLSRLDIPLKAYGFLERVNPKILEAIDTVIAKGATEVLIVPVFLLPGIHANYDIPNEITKAKKKHPSVTFYYGTTIGGDDILVDIILERLNDKGFCNKPSEKVLIIGHGSRDPEAMIELKVVVDKLDKTINSVVDVAYITAEPSYKDILKGVSQPLFIVPYLLFTGVHISNIKAQQGQHILCDPIGFDMKISDILIKRVQEAKVI